MYLDKDYIKNKIKGSLAEEIFLLMHIEMGCQVYRTGHEFMFPFLFEQANKKRKDHHSLFKEEDKSDVPLALESNAEDEVKNIRFGNTKWGTNISSSPDFTIITPSGMILQFEVKYRSNGHLRAKELEKYGSMSPAPFIFLLMKDKPYFKILSPKFVIEFDKDIQDKLGREMHPHNDQGLIKLAMDKLSVEEFNRFKRNLTDVQSKSISYIGEIQINNEDESIRLMLPSGLSSDYLIYPSDVVKKYSEIIRECYQEKVEG